MDLVEAVTQVEKELERWKAKLGDDQRADEWLRLLYDNYHRRFLSDNAQIWGVGRILLPFSLSAFAVYTGLDNPSIFHTLLLAIVSCTLSAVWLVSAENHRAFQDKSMAWLLAIERSTGIDVALPPKIPDDMLSRRLSGKAAVKLWIRGLCLGIVLAWIAIIAYQGASRATAGSRCGTQCDRRNGVQWIETNGHIIQQEVRR